MIHIYNRRRPVVSRTDWAGTAGPVRRRPPPARCRSPSQTATAPLSSDAMGLHVGFAMVIDPLAQISPASETRHMIEIPAVEERR